MSRRRFTNNSISTLEEQNLFLRIMSEKAKSSPAASAEGVSDKKSKPSSKKVKAASAARGSSQLASKHPVTTSGGDSGDFVSIPQADGPGEGSEAGSDVTSRSGSRAVSGSGNAQPLPGPSGLQQQGPLFFAPQQFVPQPMLQPFQAPQAFQPYFPQQLGQFGPCYPVGGMEFGGSPDDWEEASQASSGLATHRPVHELSDEEEEEDGLPSPGPQLEVTNQVEKDLDFSGLRPGKMADMLKAKHKKNKEGEKLGPEINETMATIVDGFFEETKVLSEMERLAKDYPRIKNLKNLRVAKLEPELFGAVDQPTRGADIALQNIQKGIVASMSALAPLGAHMLENGDLEQFSANIGDALQLLALANKALTLKRREQLKPVMQATYAKALTRPLEGDPQWLFGGNLSELAKQCEVAKKVADKMVKRKAGNQQSNQNQQQKGQNAKKFKQGQQNWQGRQQKSYFQQQPAYTQQYQQYGQPQSQFQYQAYTYKPKFQQGQQQYQQPQYQQQQQQSQQDFRQKGARK